MRKPSIHLAIPAQAEYFDLVRLTLSSLANRTGFSYEEIEDMKVAVTEACSNVVLYAYEEGAEGKIEITFEQLQDEIRIRLKDSGVGFPYDPNVPRQASLHNTSLTEANIGGLGLFFMQALMDDVQISSEPGTEVILTKRKRRKEEMA